MKGKRTERDRAQSHLESWQALIEVMPQPVSIHDTSSRIVAANGAFKEFCGSDDVLGRNCHMVVHRCTSPAEGCPLTKTLRTGKTERMDFHEPRLGKYLVVMTSPICIEGEVVGILHSLVDMTELKRSEERFRELSETYARSLEELRASEKTTVDSRDAFFNMLEDLSESYRDLEELFVGLLNAMVNTLDAKSRWTRGHSHRVSHYAESIARGMGLEEEDVKRIHLAGMLHDIGKIGTADVLLDKPGMLTKDEFTIIRKHPTMGADILKGIKQLREVIPLIRHHHERIDGKGYPDGLKGDDIPLGARILHVADSFDSMTADRPYRPSPGMDYAVSELRKFSGSQFDSEVCRVFLEIINNPKGLIVPFRIDE